MIRGRRTPGAGEGEPGHILTHLSDLSGVSNCTGDREKVSRQQKERRSLNFPSWKRNRNGRREDQKGKRYGRGTTGPAALKTWKESAVIL